MQRLYVFFYKKTTKHFQKNKIMLTPSFFKKNRFYVSQKLDTNSIAFVNSNDELPRNGDQNHIYRQNSDLFYLTGINQEQTLLVLSPNHIDENKREILFIRPTNKHLETWEGTKLTPKEASEISGIKNVKLLSELDSILPDLMFYAQNVYLSLNENLGYSRYYNDADLRFLNNLKIKYPLHIFKRLSPIIVSKRLIKTTEEIEVLKKAIELTNKAFIRVLKFTKPDIIEYEIEAEITHEFIRNGVKNHAYQPIVASGKNACILHYTPNDKPCKNGDLILMDFGAEFNNYAADLSRTIPVNGKFSDRQKSVYQSVLNVQKKAIELMTVGKTINILNDEVGKIMQTELIKLNLLSEKEAENPLAYKKYYMHGTSHFLGLDVHDVGTKDTKFEAGMVLTCEPGIYIEEENIGVRLENDILITDSKPVDLMSNIPIEISDIEKLMS